MSMLRNILKSYEKITEPVIILDKVVDESSTINGMSGDQQITSCQPPKKMFVCNINDCGKEYPNRSLYEKHLRRSHSNKTLRCDRLGCDYVTSCDEYLKNHLQRHSKNRPFACVTNGCGKKFKAERSLERHQNSHTWGLFECTQSGCDYRCTFETTLKKHIARYHGQEFRCDHSGCDYVTSKRGLMTKHAEIHSESRPFVCGTGGSVEANISEASLSNDGTTPQSERFVRTKTGDYKLSIKTKSKSTNSIMAHNQE